MSRRRTATAGEHEVRGCSTGRDMRRQELRLLGAAFGLSVALHVVLAGALAPLPIRVSSSVDTVLTIPVDVAEGRAEGAGVTASEPEYWHTMVSRSGPGDRSNAQDSSQPAARGGPAEREQLILAGAQAPVSVDGARADVAVGSPELSVGAVAALAVEGPGGRKSIHHAEDLQPDAVPTLAGASSPSGTRPSPPSGGRPPARGSAVDPAALSSLLESGTTLSGGVSGASSTRGPRGGVLRSGAPEANATTATSGRRGEAAAGQGALSRDAGGTPTKTLQYPRSARRAGQQGTVKLQVEVGQDGSVSNVRVAGSSGNAELDRTAENWVRSEWQFKPAIQDGEAAPGKVNVNVEFKLEDPPK